MSTITARIAELARLDPGRTLFGADSHDYVLHPPLAEAELAAFETQHGVMLPTDYRDFLLTVANGGAGPEYGILPLADALEGQTPALPFRYSTAEARELIAARQRDPECYAMLGDDDDADGLVALCDAGCGWTHYLVVTGVQRGTVWTGGELGYCPLYDETGAQHTFATWYDAWLSASLRELTTTQSPN